MPPTLRRRDSVRSSEAWWNVDVSSSSEHEVSIAATDLEGFGVAKLAGHGEGIGDNDFELGKNNVRLPHPDSDDQLEDEAIDSKSLLPPVHIPIILRYLLSSLEPRTRMYPRS